MILRTIKKISPEDTKRIETIRKKEICISSLNDYSLLLGQVEEGCKKANNLYKNSKLNKIEIDNLLTKRVKVGKYKTYKTGFSEYGKDIYFGENDSDSSDAYFTVGLKTETIEPIAQNLNLLLGNKFSENLYTILPYYNRPFGTIELMTIGFYNKINIYKTIYKSFLLEERGWLEETLGETLTKNLTELFSANVKQTKTKNFNITKENDFKFVMKMDEKTNKLGPEYKKIGFSGILCPSPKNLSGIEIKVFLGPNNTLVEEAKPWMGVNQNEYPFSKYAPPRPGNIQFEDNSRLSEALEKENVLNDFLVNLEQLTNFGYEIYKKVQANILVGNI